MTHSADMLAALSAGASDADGGDQLRVAVIHVSGIIATTVPRAQRTVATRAVRAHD